MADKTIKKNIVIKNRRASFDYLFLEKYKAGIVLTGTEIKSIRKGKASLVDTFCYFDRHEIWVKNMYIAPYFYGSYGNHAERRDRKLLLTKKEIRKLEQEIKNPGLTIVPVVLYIEGNHLAKVEIALARGKKQYDKRQALKEKDDRREMDRSFKRY
ncbi:MAG TPA: SsrA-binding protein [Prevotellaceae bacterium]|nr:SsrA-binding protein [Prevotellaceae bacterium]